MKPLKIIGLVAAGLVGLVLVAAVLVYLLVNPNDFKPKIAAAVKGSTGRELNLQGDIKLSVFPWVALTLGPASLGNPPGFDGAPLLSFKRADVRVRLLPLLSKHLEVSKIVLDGLDLRLVKKPDGSNNWQVIHAQATAAAPDNTPGEGASLDSIGGIEVTHGRVSYNQYVIDNLDFQTGTIASNRPVSVSLAFEANRGSAGETVSLAAKLQLQGNSDTKDLRIDSLDVKGDVHRATGDPLHYELSGTQLEVNVDKQTLSLPQFSLGLGAAKVSGKIAGTQIVDDLHLAGSVALAPVALRDFAGGMGVSLPRTRDTKALSAFSAGTGFTYDATGVAFQDLQMKLDDSTLQGQLAMGAGKTGAITFKLAVDHIDVDRYRPPADSASETPTVAKSNAPPDDSAPLTAQGTFTLGAAHAAGLDFSKLGVTVQMKDKVTHLYPLEAQLYGGRYSGNITYDARAAVPRISMDEHLTNVDISQLVANTKGKGRIVGRATVNIKGTAAGADADGITKSLNGSFDANLANGALSGVDLGYEIALAQALLNKQTSTTVANTHQTGFDAFKVSAQIANGIATTHDLVISSAVLKVTGQGTLNVPTSGIDLRLITSFMKGAGQSAVDIPLNVTGSYTSPSVKPDLTALAKDQLKQKAQDLLKKNGIDLNNLFKKK